MKLSEKASNIKVSETLSISAKANKLNELGRDIINFSAGEPDFNTPEHIKKAAIEAINDNFTKYTPGEGLEELRKAVCKKLKNDNNLDYNFNQVVITNGTKQAIFNALAAISDIGDEIIIPAPYWASYPEIVKLTGGTPVIIYTQKEACFKVTVNQLKEHLTDKTKAIILNSPSNPSGMVYTEDELKKIAEFAVKNDLYVISDEVYEKLIYSNKLQHVSIASLNDEIYNKTIVINGLSKSHSMTGWRVGYSASNNELAVVMANIQSQSTSNVNSVAQKAAVAALTGDQSCVDLMVTEFKHRRDYISQRISDIPFLSSLIPKGAFYLFVDISKLCGGTIGNKKIKKAYDVASVLLDKYQVAVVPCTAFGYDDYIRLSFAISMPDIVEGINRIERFVKENY